MEVAEVADLKRKEYRNDIRQLAPLRKPIEDCDKSRVYAEKGGGCRIKGIPIIVGGHLHGVRMVATAVLPPRVSRSRAGAVRFPSDWGVTQFLVDVTLDASQRHHSKLICRTAKRLENPDPRGGRGRFCKRARGLEDLMEPALIK